jgi:hAT family C-terminal dimerisation region
LQLDRLEAFEKFYNGNVDDLNHECHQLKRLITRISNDVEKPNSLQSLAKFLGRYKLAFHELYRLTTIAIVLPVSSAACERSFSALKLIKSYLRNSMIDVRLSNIALLQSERARNIDFDAFVNEFDAKHANRKLALQ